MATAETNAFTVEITEAPGVQEMYIKAGGDFVKYTPKLTSGDAFVEPDAYVISGGAWVKVHEAT